MADKDFRIDLILGAKFAEAFRAIDQAQRKIGDVDKAAGKFSRGAGAAVGTALRTTAVAGVAAATAAAAVMSLYIAKTIEAEKVQAQLQSRLKDTGGVAGRTLEQLNQQAARLQSITIFDDEAIGSAQAMLLTFNQIRGVNFDRTTEAALDLATVMGTDATDAAKVLGKALSDPEKGLYALSRAGVVFTDAERTRIQTMVEAGQVAEAQGVILDKLSGTMGSAAGAARDTLGGAVQALKNSFDNLLEGDTGDEGIQGARAAIEGLVDTLNDPDTKAGFDTVVTGLFKVANAAVQVVANVANAASALREYLGSSDKQSATMLANRKTDLESELFSVARKSGVGYRWREQAIKEELADIEAQMAQRARAQSDRLAAQGVDAGFDALRAPPSNPKPDGQGVAKPGKTKSVAGTKSDPDADIKRRIESLREETALLGMIEEGEDRASEAAKARYDITEGEFKNKSQALKDELLAAAEAQDAKNKDIEAEKKRLEAIEESRDAYRELVGELRTPAEVAVDEAIAKLNLLTEAMQRGETGGLDVKRVQQDIIDKIFEPAPDLGLGGYDPLAELERKQQELDTWYQSQLAALARFRQEKADLTAEANAKEAAIEAQHQESLKQLQTAQSDMLLGAASSMFGSLADIARAGAGEQSKAYQVLFALSKGFAVAQASVSLGVALARASEKPWPMNLPAIADAFAVGAQIAQIIASASYSPGGYADGGYTGPGGKYEPAGVVHKGEGVLSQEEIAAIGGPAGFYRLRAMIDEGALRERAFGWAGYAAGGLVGDSSPALPAPDWASHPRGGAGVGPGLLNQMSLYLFQDRDALAQALASHPVTRKAIVAEISENGGAVQASWGSNT